MSTTHDYGEPWYFDEKHGCALTRDHFLIDQKRAISCVTACANMADPKKEISEIKAQAAQLTDIRQRLKGHPDSQLDGENGLAAATMRGFEQLEKEVDKWRGVAALLAEELRYLLEPEYLSALSRKEDSELSLVASAHKSADKALGFYEAAKLTKSLP